MLNYFEVMLSIIELTARQTIFSKPWNIMESQKRPSKYHLSINYLAEKKDRISHHWKVQNKTFSVISKCHISIKFLAKKRWYSMLKKKSSYRFLKTERLSFSFLKISCKFRKYYGKIIFLPTSCVEKDILLLPEIHNINVSFIRKIHKLFLSS